ncbi:MAG TPA: class I SAM-dependent methyltransferase [Planctomycetota bacterium]|nr:class I SAM-dependent methyltransferase [Planctomycetota bacterium]
MASNDDASPPPLTYERKGFEEHYAQGFIPWDSGEVDPELKRLLDAGQLPGKTVLEIGCGTGTNAIEFARRGFDVIAVDFVAQAVDEARKKAAAAKVKIDLRVADVLHDDLGGPYDVIFDRGVYHGLRSVHMKKFQQVLEKVTRKGSRFLVLAGNAKEENKGMGPPRVHEHEFRSELGGLFNFLEVREFRFGTNKEDFRPLGWSILMERK